MLTISAYSLCKMYHEQCFTTEQIIDKLVHYDYKKPQYSYDHLSEINMYTYNSFDDIVLAKEHKFISNDIFNIVYERVFKKYSSYSSQNNEND